VASQALGGEAAAAASNFKLMRVAFLALVAVYALVSSRSRKDRMVVPWFMVVFFVLAVAADLSTTISSLRGTVEPVSRFSLCAALSAIGMSLDFNSITSKGPGPLFAVFLSWGIAFLTLYLLVSVAW